MTNDKVGRHPVGRKSRRAEDRFPPRFDRAGFEPLRGPATSLHFKRLEIDDTLGAATHTHGSNPARAHLGRKTSSARRDFRPTGWNLRSVICHLSFVILFAGCSTRPTFRTVVLD